MLRAVACPKCSEELDVPEELLAQPVRCASCATVFTPNRAGPPAARPRGESRNRLLDEDERPRRGPPRKSGRGLVVLLTLVLGGGFGTCCLGCGGLMAIGMRIEFPTPHPYTAPDGKFSAVFPAPPTATPAVTLPNGQQVNGVSARRNMMLQTMDTCTVTYTDLPAAPRTDAARDRVLQAAADEVQAKNPASKFVVQKLTTQGYPAVDLSDATSEPQAGTFVRVVLADGRLYTVTYAGRNLTPDSPRLQTFWDGFRILKTDPAPERAPDPPAPKPKAKVKEPKPAPDIDE